jgi:hypothetical protein
MSCKFFHLDKRRVREQSLRLTQIGALALEALGPDSCVVPTGFLQLTAMKSEGFYYGLTHSPPPIFMERDAPKGAWSLP